MFERELHSLCISLPSFRTLDLLPILIMTPMLGKHGVVCLSSSDMLLVTVIFTHPSLSIIENKIVLLARTAELHDRNRQTEKTSGAEDSSTVTDSVQTEVNEWSSCISGSGSPWTHFYRSFSFYASKYGALHDYLVHSPLYL